MAPHGDHADGKPRHAPKWGGGGGGDKCGRCAKTVYLAEKKQAAGNVS